MNGWPIRFFSVVMLFLLVAAGATAEPIASSRTASDRIDRDIRYFASDELKGRGVGTEGLDLAAQYIAERFTSLGLKTDLFQGQPFQALRVDTGVELGDPQKNSLKIFRDGIETLDFEVGTSFNPLALGSTGSVSGELVFVGYGITAPTANFDEYANVNVNGRIVMVIRKEPRLGQQDHPLGKTSPTPAAYFSTKVANAVTRGAAGILFINDRESAEQLARQAPGDGSSKDADEHAILGLMQAGKGAKGKKVPVASISRKFADKLLRDSLGRGLVDIEDALEAFEPQSALLPAFTGSLSTDLRFTDVLAKNVIGELPGAGSLASETVIVGAHYDHVGMGGIGSLAPGTVAVHNGADDNASGTAALLEIARSLCENKASERRRIVFIAFTGEERGLLGSAHYVRNPRFDLEQTVAMLNLDMVGRLKDNFLSIYGTGTASSFDAMLDQLNNGYEFRLEREPSGYGPSDHQSFYERKIPVLHFFTGLHNDYHRPSDDFDKINLSGMVRITDMVSEATLRIATDPMRPQYQTTQRGKGIRKQKSAYLGVQLRMTDEKLTISSVVPDGPAASAGLLAGDVIERCGERQLTSIPSLLDELSRRSGGETLLLGVRRANESLSVEVKLGEQ